MSASADHRVPSPQARGRELAREGKLLWQRTGSVKRAAAHLMSRHPEIPCMQAYRYAAGLSQDQAALRYNEVADHQTTLGGTTINAWETWARARGQGSPPSYASLLILAKAYGKGPSGVSQEVVTPGELVAEAYERLSPEGQLAIRAAEASARAESSLGQSTAPSGRRAGADDESVRVAEVATARELIVGPDCIIDVPTVENGNPAVRAFSLPNPHPGLLLHLNWQTFGLGVERLGEQIKNLGRRLDADVCFGINEAGLVMATFLSSSQFNRCAIGYLRMNRVGDELGLAVESFFPSARPCPIIIICDFEVKHADVVGFVAREIRQRYPRAELYFAVFGAMTKEESLQVSRFDQLTGAEIMKAAGFHAVFVAATMSPPGIEPPLELR